MSHKDSNLVENFRRRAPRVIYEFTCIGLDGKIKWEDKCPNIVTNEGLNSLLDFICGNVETPANVYVVLNKNDDAVSASMVYATQGLSANQWSEVTTISEATRVVWTHGSVSSQSVSNSASTASFSISGTVTVYGAGLVYSPSDSANISVIGNTAVSDGVLYSIGAFSSSRAVESGDTLQVTATITTADDGV